MWSTLTRLVLLVLHTAQSQEKTKTPQKLDQIVAPPGDSVQISCRLPPGSQWWTEAMWYKERRDRSLQRIYWSYRNSNPEGKYSGPGPHLTISNVQRNDSGVYYCDSSTSWNLRLIHGVRLIVPDTPRPSRSVLVPFPMEGPRPDLSVPLLCLTLDANPTWHNFSWAIGEESSQDQKGVGVMDEDGVFSIWHLETIPWEEWTEKKAYFRSLQENKISNAVTPTDEGNSERGANRTPRRETLQTNYAEVRYKSGEVPCVE